MSLQELLASGLLESYALGMCSPDEERTVQQLLGKYPEARQELDQIEGALETYASSRSVPPPAWLKGRIMDNIGQIQPSSAMPTASPRLLSNPAVWALTAAALVLGYFGYHQYQQASTLRQSSQTFEQAARDCAAREQDLLRASKQDMAFVTDPGTKPVSVDLANPDDKGRFSPATVFFNPAQRRALINPAALPPAPAQRDYQLWVIVKDNPAPIPLNVLDTGNMAIVAYPADAVAFAVSIEPKGGSPNGKPTEVILLGNCPT
jgi:hypothetical protein